AAQDHRARCAARAQGGHQGAVGAGARRQTPQRSQGDLMATVLVLVEHSGGQVRTASLPAVSFGKLMAESAGGKLELLVIGASRFKRPILAGNVIEHVEVQAPIVCATIRQTEFPPAQPGGAGTVHTLAPAGLDARGAEFVSLSASKSERPELTEAKIVVSGG